jgi:glycosyltransferase involved in cell wall biosynthesis
MNDDRKCLSVIVPVYYNEPSLSALYQEISHLESKLAELYNMKLELIFIDDGSGDQSFVELQKIKAARPLTKLIKLTRNFGAVEASSLGFHYASGDCCSIISADLQDPPAQLLNMIAEWQRGSKFVLSRRRSRKDPFLTRLFAKIYYLFVELFVFKDYPKGGFDLMLFDKQILPYLKDLSGNVNYQLYLFWLGFAPTILESDRTERMGGKSRWTFSKKFNHFINSIAGFSVRPLRLISGIGILVSAVSFSYGLFVFVAALLNDGRPPGFAAVYVLVSFFGGIIVAMLSIIGEYIWRIFELANKKPTRVIDECHL